MMDFAMGICRLFVKPLGSKRMWLNLLQRSSSGTPYCSAMEMAVAKASIRPEMVEPCFAIVMKISPGICVSGYNPMWRYPSWPAMRSEEHTSELQSRENLVCRLLLEKKKTIIGCH